MRYCSKEHQVLDWKTHKLCCGDAESSQDQLERGRKAKIIFPEYEIVSEPEPPLNSSIISQDQLADFLATSQGLDSAAAEEELEELENEDETEVGVDKAFLDFQKRIQLEPQQIVRYLKDEGSIEDVMGIEEDPEKSVSEDEEDEALDSTTSPLWVSDQGKPGLKEIPTCEYCNSERQCEFQIMPQVLNYLDIDHSAPDALDFGSLFVYTCPNNCQPSPQQSYMNEFVWRQDFSKDSMANHLN
jgi:pre-rRNA-processing protein TSR4